MKPQIHHEPRHVPSDFLTFNTRFDVFRQSSVSAGEEAALPPLLPATIPYLRVELARIRTGMSDYLVRLSTPMIANQPHSNTLLTLRANKTHSGAQGIRDFVATVIDEMSKREDLTHTWETANADHLASLLMPYLKFFAANTSTESMQFTTEALL